MGKKLKNMTDTNLLLTITIVVFFVMYIGAIVFQGKGFLKPQTFFNILNANAALIILSCGMSLVMITGTGSSHWPCFRYRTGLPGSIPGYPALYRDPGGYVLRQRYDNDRKYQTFQRSQRKFHCFEGNPCDRSRNGLREQTGQLRQCLCGDRCDCGAFSSHSDVYHASLDQDGPQLLCGRR